MSYHRQYKLKDDRFGLLALTLREKAGLTQTEVSTVLGVSERTIRHWEALSLTLFDLEAQRELPCRRTFAKG